MLYKKILTLCIYYSCLQSADLLDSPVLKKNSSFSTIGYKPLLEILKKYNLKGSSLPLNQIKMNQLLYSLDYFDLGAVQVFKQQKRKNDFEAIKDSTYEIRKELYEKWFLDKNSFFIKITSSLTSLKEKYIDPTNTLKKIDFANKYITDSLQNILMKIIDETKQSIAKEKKEHSALIAEVVSASEEKIQEFENEIIKINKNIDTLNETIKLLKEDTINWQSDLEQFNKQKAIADEIATATQKKTSPILNDVDLIQKKQQEAMSAIQDFKKKEKSLLSIQSQKANLEALLKSVEAYKKLKDQPLNFLPSFTSNISIFESSELKDLREDIITKAQKLNLPELTTEKIFDAENKISEKTFNTLKNYINSDNIKSQQAEIAKSIAMLEQEAAALNKQISTKMAEIAQIQKETTDYLTATMEQEAVQFNHKELFRGSSEPTIINNAIMVNNNKITELTKMIDAETKKIKTLKENISLNREGIKDLTKQYSITEKERIEKIENLKIEKLKNIDYSTIAQNYVKNIASTYDMSSQKNEPSPSPLLAIGHRLALLLYDLTIVCTIEPLQDKTVASLEGKYIEQLNMLDSLKYKAANLQKEAENQLAALKSAFFSNRNTYASQQRPTTNTIKNQNNHLYYKVDQGLIENIQAKIAAIKNDLGAMITHTLTIAQSLEPEYQKLIAIQNCVFMPLCNQYEQLTRVTESWLKNYQQSNEPVNIKNIKQEYAKIMSFSQSLADHKKLIITDKDSVLVAELFFKAVSENLLSKITAIKTNTDKTNNDQDNDQFFKQIFSEILMYELIIKTVESTQLRWYNFEKTVRTDLKQKFKNLKEKLLDKKIELALTLTPENITFDSTKQDIFLNKTDHIDGRLIDATKESILIEQFFIRLSTLFKPHTTIQSNNHATLKLKEAITNIQNNINEQNAKLQHTLFDQVMKQLYTVLNKTFNNINFATQTKKKIPSTNPFDQLINFPTQIQKATPSTNPFDPEYISHD